MSNDLDALMGSGWFIYKTTDRDGNIVYKVYEHFRALDDGVEIGAGPTLAAALQAAVACRASKEASCGLMVRSSVAQPNILT